MARKINKLTRYKNSPAEVSFNELKSLLESFGFEVKNYSGGSHFSVSHKKYNVIDIMEPNTIPAKKPHVLRVYVNRAVRWIEKVIEMQESEQDKRKDEKNN